MGLYWIAQIAGGILGAFLTIYFKGKAADVPVDIDHFKALFAEFFFTFALCYVVLNVATVQATAGNSFYGLAIGFTVLAGAYAVGAISSAAFNPAVGLGLSFLNLSHWSNLWVYIVGNLLGGAAAAYIVNEAHPGE